ncbi:dynactin subunit 3 [Trichonephila clavipes]|uniref:Dynactin subunit 3 n=1 Tax=Trichonephila inaurata madagascariensis TaxID=2747483 RepID=A0A8X7C6S6_9ARAC|nr:dynactin subunit 3 [Trichonephila clavipes]GFY56028.1 dynactin subunit 3 [Trichonephila inaurata madagascariensis]
MTDEASLESLERRISKLERDVYSSAIPDPENKCIETLMNIHNRLQSAVTGREKITTVFSKLDDLQKYLDPSFKEHVSLTETAKLNLVLLEEDRIRSAVDSLQTVKDLIQYLDSEHIRAVPSLCPKLYEVSQAQIKLQEDAAELTTETRQLIANYDNLIMSLSKQFILWDSMLTEIEKGKIKKEVSS